MILNSVDNALSDVATEHRLLNSPFSLVPQRHSTELTAPDVSVVSQETILLSINV